MQRNLWEVSETDAQPTPMAYVHTVVAVDHGGIDRAKRNMSRSYFYHSGAGSLSTASLFSMKQNNIVFSLKTSKSDSHVPLVRAALNGLDYKPEILHLIEKINDDSIPFDRKTKDKMIQEILMTPINVLGSIKGDGFMKKDDGSTDISHDIFTIESAGTIQVRIRNKPLHIGAECEFKVPLKHEWESGEEWSKDEGKLSLYVDPIEKQTEFEKISQLFYQYNPYENQEMTAMIENLMVRDKKHLPSGLKMVYAFCKLMKAISLLSRQKAISSGVVKIKTTRQFPEFNETVERIPQLIGSNFRVLTENTSNLSGSSTGNFKISDGIIEVPAYSPFKFNNLASLTSLKDRSIFGVNTDLNNFMNSLDLLTITALTAKLSQRDDVNYNRYVSESEILPSEGHLRGFDKETFTKFTDIQDNWFRHMYKSLIISFLPNNESEYYGFGFQKSGDDPEVNPKIYSPIKVVDEVGDDERYRFTSVVSFKTIQNNFVINYDRDSGRSSNVISECLPNLLNFLIMYFKERDHGYRMTVVDSANYKEKGTVYVRC